LNPSREWMNHMSEDDEVNCVNAEINFAVHRQQMAWREHQCAWRVRVRCTEVYWAAHVRQQQLFVLQQEAWDKWTEAQDQTSPAFQASQIVYAEQQRTWFLLVELRDRLGPQIIALRTEHDELFQRVRELSESINTLFERGLKSLAHDKLKLVKELRDRMEVLPPEWKRMTQEIAEARTIHTAAAKEFKPVQAEFRRLRKISDAAKIVHRTARSDFREAQQERLQAKDLLDVAKLEHERCSALLRNAHSDTKRIKDRLAWRDTALPSEPSLDCQ
jgi:hypothetical protein